MKALHIVFAVLASWRLTEIITQERIFERVRVKWPLYLWSCSRCVSVWAGVIATALVLYYPYANWPLALSWLFNLHAEISHYVRRRHPPTMPRPSIILSQGENDTVRVDHNGVSEAQAQEIIVRLASTITDKNLKVQK